MAATNGEAGRQVRMCMCVCVCVCVWGGLTGMGGSRQGHGTGPVDAFGPQFMVMDAECEEGKDWW